ncbi:MAG: DUF1697 domain-containing protein [Sphingobacteriales bacterium]
MPTTISILRGINVSGQKKILMADLKALYEQRGFKDVTTYIQSGNVVFRTDKKLTNAELAQIIEKDIKTQFGFDVPVITRTSEEWNKIITANPFMKKKEINSDKLHVTFLSQEPDKANIKIAESFSYLPDEFSINGSEVFLHIPDSYGNTKLSNNFFENKLKVSATTRNWKTVITLAEIVSAG